MIKLNLDRVMQERRVNLTELADRIGITLANLSILKTNKARAIRFTNSTRSFCRALECQPGELLGFVPGEIQKKRMGIELGISSSRRWRVRRWSIGAATAAPPRDAAASGGLAFSGITSDGRDLNNGAAGSENRTHDLSLTKGLRYHYATAATGPEAVFARAQLRCAAIT